MHAIKQILVVVDPTSAVQHCVEKGARLARAYGAVLELYICDCQSALRFKRLAPADAVERARHERRMQLVEQLEALAKPLRHAGLKVFTDCSFNDHVHVGVIAKVRKSGTYMVIKDTHSHGGMRRALFTRTDWHLVRECPVLLLLTKPKAWHVKPRMAAALDTGHVDDKPATFNQELLKVTEGLALAMRGEVRAVHCFESLALFAGMTLAANGIGNVPAINTAIVESQREFLRTQLEAEVSRHPAFENRSVLIDGSPAAALPAYAAREEIDVIVTGAVSRSARRRLIAGSTAERLLDRLPCDILVVKPTQGSIEPQAAVDL